MSKQTNNPNIKPSLPKVAKTVRLSTYLQSLAIAILVTGVISFIGGYFISINLHEGARAQVYSDIQLSKDQTSQNQ